jgi:hypothetical protein
MSHSTTPTALPPPQKVRFAQLVKDSGKPEVMTLWADPKKDNTFMQLVKKHRVLTVVQKPTGNKKDFGFIGFHPQPFASFMVFPKSLAEAEGVQVIGIKYDLIAELKPGLLRIFKPQKSAKFKPAPKAPVIKTFQAKIERTLTQLLEFDVAAVTIADAKKKAIVQAEEHDVPENCVKTRERILDIVEKS